MYALLRIVTQEWQVDNQRDPVSVDQEQEGQESVDSDFGDDVRVEAVAEIDRVDIVTMRNNRSASQPHNIHK